MTTTHELSTTSLAASLGSDIEGRLASVRDRIAAIEAELPVLRSSEAFLLNVQATVTEDPAAAAVPAPRAPRVTRPKTAAALAPAAAADETAAAAAPTGSRPRATAGRRKTTARTASRVQQTRAAGEPTLPDRVLEFLQAQSGPQTAVEIAAGLFGAGPSTKQVGRVRAAAEALAGRGVTDKSKQGKSVFFQHVVPATPADADAPPGGQV